MKTLVKSILFVTLAAVPWIAQAKIFMCKDSSGRTITSDRPIPECADRAVKELDNNGMARREIARPLTAEEAAQKKAEEEKRKVEAAAAAERSKNDQLLLARFATEKDLEVARRRTVDYARDQLKVESSSLAEAEKKLEGIQVELEAAKKRPKGPGPDLLRRVEESEKLVKDRKKAVLDREALIAQSEASYSEMLKRFREIMGAAAAPAAASAPAPAAADTPAPASPAAKK
ncbi:hypothetical protein BH11PSE11_BH11PSE11_09370 [soil metagenome]